MNIVGVDQVVFGVDDLAAAARFYTDFGLRLTKESTGQMDFEALDGTGASLRLNSDPTLPALAPGSPSPNVRETVWGVGDRRELDRIVEALSGSREVRVDADGVVHTTDPAGYALAFRVTARRPYAVVPAVANVPGIAARGKNKRMDFAAAVTPRSIAHIVMLVPDVEAARAFYVDQLKFRISDTFTDVGHFLRPAGYDQHHGLFVLKRPDLTPTGMHHLAWSVTDCNEMMMGGQALIRKGWRSAHGPGRHILGSSYFWYFHTPASGGANEYSADMDTADDEWVPRELVMTPAVSAIWLNEFVR